MNPSVAEVADEQVATELAEIVRNDRMNPSGDSQAHLTSRRLKVVNSRWRTVGGTYYR